MMNEIPEGGSKRIVTLLLIGLLGGVGWVYSGVLSHPFHFDDALFLNSAQVNRPENIWQTLSPWQTRQLTYFSFALNYKLAGPEPASYHMVNLVLHLTCTALVFLFVRRLAGTPGVEFDTRTAAWLPPASAAVFALHPVQSEVVNYAYQRSTLLAACFSLGALCLFLARGNERGSAIRWIPLCVLFLLAAAGKEAALVLPLVLVANLWAFSGSREKMKQRLYRTRSLLLPLAAVMVAGTAWFLAVLYQSAQPAAGLAAKAATGFRYFVTQTRVIVTYLRMLVWPSGLSIDHDYPVASLYSAYTWYCMALLVLLLFLSLRLRRSRPALAFLLVSFFLFLAPTSSFIPSADPIFEHRLYLPMIAAAPLIAWAPLVTAWKFPGAVKWRPVLCLVLLGLQLAGYSVVSRERTYIWGDNVRLWEDAVAKAPHKARPRYNLGAAYLSSDRGKARAAFEKTLELQPGHAAALYNLGWLEQSEGRLESALRLYQTAISSDPESWQAYHNLGNVWLLRGDFREAQRSFATAAGLNPEYWPAYQSLATAQILNGDTRDALSTLTELRRMAPDLLEPQYLMARALIGEGRLREAERELVALSGRDIHGLYKAHLESLRQDLEKKP